MYFDTHCHLDNQQFSDMVEDVVGRAALAGVDGITAIGTDVKTSRRCVEIAEQIDQVYAAVGIHPTVCQNFTEDDWDSIVELVQHPQVVAIGETGLDLHWDTSTFELQKQWFQRHIDLSFEKDLPLVIHMRDCELEIVEMLQGAAIDDRIHGVMHSFTGTVESAERCLALGMYISFAGMVTFKKSDDLRAVAATIPNDRLLIETDAPYLSPHPLRSKRPNEPSYLIHTAACLADVKGISPEELGKITTENAKHVFRV